MNETPQGPVMVTNVGAYVPPPRTQARMVEVTVTIPVYLSGKMDLPENDQIAKALSRILADWNEGRRPLQVELVQDAMARLVQKAIMDAKQQEVTQDPKQLEHVPCNGGSCSRFIVTMDNWRKEAQPSADGSIDPPHSASIKDRVYGKENGQ